MTRTPIDIHITEPTSMTLPSGSVNSRLMYCGLVTQTSVITATGSAPMIEAEAFASCDIA